MKSKSSKIRTAAALAARNQSNITVRRMLKLTLVILNRIFGFGRERLAQFSTEFNELCKEAETDEVFWGHIDRIVIDELGVNMEREREG